jgi:hypothetical protein
MYDDRQSEEVDRYDCKHDREVLPYGRVPYSLCSLPPPYGPERVLPGESLAIALRVCPSVSSL